MQLLFGLLLLFGAAAAWANEPVQVEIQVEFVAFDKAALDQLANTYPNQIPDLQILNKLRQEGKATVLCAPRVITKSGANAEVKAVEEIIYPTEIATELITNAVGQTMGASIFPSSFQTRDVGAILSVTPIVSPDLREIDLTLMPQMVMPPTWSNYPAKYIDATGAEHTAHLPQPYFHSRIVTTSIGIKNGQTVIAGGGMNELGDKTTVFLFITAQLVDSEGSPVQIEDEEEAAAGPGNQAQAAMIPAEKLTQTIVTPHLECPLEKKANILWCATFQLAWDQLRELAGGPIQLKRGDADCDILNKGSISSKDLDAASYIAVAGMGPATLDRINQELRQRFGAAAHPQLLPSTLESTEWIAYAYLFQHLPFNVAFTRIREPLDFCGAKVVSFGIDQYSPKNHPNEEKIARQVNVLDYRSLDDFIVELEPSNSAQRIILAQIPPASNLADLVKTAQARIVKAKPTPMDEGATLQIPLIDLDLLKTYFNLQGKMIIAKDPKFNDSLLVAAQQAIRFRLDEQGAILKSEAVVALEGAGPGQTRILKNLIFRKPFLVLLQKKDAKTPYFALWVANAELLKKYYRQKNTD